jgi:hypothetical protein
MTFRGKRAALALGGAFGAAIAVSALVERRSLQEWWSVRSLRSTDRAAQQRAAGYLRDHGSTRAIQPLLRAIAESKCAFSVKRYAMGVDRICVAQSMKICGCGGFTRAIAEISRRDPGPALKLLDQALRSEEEFIPVHAAHILGELGPLAAPEAPALQEAAKSGPLAEDPEFIREVLAKIGKST